MFKLVSVNINEGIMNILDTVDGVTDSLKLEDVQSILDLGVVKIEGINTEDGEISIGRDVEILDNTQELNEEYDEEYVDEDEEDLDYDDEEEYQQEDGEEDDSWFDDDEDEFYEDISKTNMYDSVPENIGKIIKDYYKWYTKELYHDLASTIRLGISNKKAEQLANIKNRGDYWSFEGIFDTGAVCSCCTLGHDIRYEYHASNEHGETIIFGRDCAGDFFNLDKEQLRNLTRAQNKMTEEAIECIENTIIGKVGVGKEGLDLLYGVLFKLDENNMLDFYLPPKLSEFLEKYVNNGIALPESMVKMIRRNISKQFFKYGNFEMGVPVTKNVTSLLVDVFGTEYKILSAYFEEGAINKYKRDQFALMLSYALVNQIDGKYAHNPLTGICKEEGSCRKERRYKWNMVVSSLRRESILPNKVNTPITFDEFSKSVELYKVMAEIYDEISLINKNYKVPISKLFNMSHSCRRVDTKKILDYKSDSEELTQREFFEKYRKELGYFDILSGEVSSTNDVDEEIKGLVDNKDLYIYWLSKVLELNHTKNPGVVDSESMSETKTYNESTTKVVEFKQKTRLADDECMMRKVKGIINAHERHSREFTTNRKDFYFNIASTVMKYGSFTEKQQKFINEGFEWVIDNGLDH